MKTTLNALELVNLAFRVSSIDEAEAFVAEMPGWSRRAVHDIDGERFLEASFGGMRVNFFETALYDREGESPRQPAFLHMSFSLPSLAAALESHEWKDKLVWGPQTISGGFGRRRIAFFEPIEGCRIELMEEIGE